MREKAVLRYLRDNPRFLRRNQSELTRMLRLAERDIVDLTGKQLETLREENTKMRKQLLAWYKAAAENEDIIEFLHRYSTRLVRGDGKRGEAAKELRLEAKRSLGIGLCRLVDLDAGEAELSDADGRRLGDSLGALRTDAPLPSLKKVVPKASWKSFLSIPVYKGKRIRAVVVLGSAQTGHFPRDAHTDYAVRLAETVSAALDREG